MKRIRYQSLLLRALLLPAAVSTLSAATRTWDAGGATNDWGVAGNWTASVAPVAGDALVFPASVPGSPFPVLLQPADKVMNNTIATNTFFAGLTFSSSGYSLTGNAFDLNTGGIVISHDSGTTTLSPTIRLMGAGQSFDSGTGSGVLILGALNLNGNSLSLTGEGRIGIGGNIVNSVGTATTVTLTKAGAGDAALDGFNNFIGTVEVTAGRLFANGFIAGAGALNVRNGATLAGEDGGIDKSVLIEGTLAPGTLTDITRPMEFDGNLTFSTASSNTRTLKLDLRSAAPGTGYDQIGAGAGVTLNSANLVLDFGTFRPAVGTPLVLISKTSAGAISGTFAGIAQGATLTVDGQRLQFSYTGGDGNDFTATPLNVLPVVASLGVATSEDTPVAVPLSADDPNPQTLTYSIVAAPGNGTLSGTAPNLTYTPDANFNGTDTFTFRANDGVGNSNTATVSITVAAVNDAPTATSMGSTQLWIEDTDENLNDIVVTDVDDLIVTVTLELKDKTAGELTRPSSGLVTPTFDAATGIWRASGLKSSVNSILAAVIFKPAPNYDNSFRIAVTVTDGVATITDEKLMACAPVNDAPTATNLSAPETYTEDTDEDIIDIVISDVDDTETTITLTLSNSAAGDLKPATMQGVEITTTASPRAWTARGSITAVNQWLAALSYDPALNFNANFSIDTNVSDGSQSVSGRKLMHATAVNDAPTATGLSSFEDYVEDTVEPLNDIVISDVDSSIVRATLAIPVAAGRLKEVSSGDAKGEFDETTGIWTAEGPIADVNQVLADVSFIPAENFNGNFSITTTISDLSLSVTGSKPIQGVAVNDAPRISAIAGRTIPEDGTTGPITFTVSDVDNPVAALTIGRDSDDLTLVPLSGINIPLATGSTRTVTVTPAPNESGTVLITLTVSDGTASAASSFVLTVTPVNDAPTVTAIANRTIPEDGTTGPISFTVSDVETPAASLTILPPLTGNPRVVPAGGIVFGGSGSSRTVTVTPAPNENGTALITFAVGDGTVSTPVSFTITVTPVNDPPFISVIADRTIPEDGSVTVAFTVSDIDSPLSGLKLEDAGSSNTALLPVSRITQSLSGANGTATLRPAANRAGTTEVTLSVIDSADRFERKFDLNVTPVNDRPTISSVANISVRPGQSGTVSVTVSDVETSAGSLGFSASSSVQAVVPNGNFSFGVPGASRTVTITPAPLALGTTRITLTVTDGAGATESTSFDFTVSLLTPLQQWRQNQFATASNTGSAANDFDFDGDGLSNLMEFALGLDPKNPASSALPQPVPLDTDGDSVPDALSLSFTPPAGVSDVSFAGETTSSLQEESWSPVSDTGAAPRKEYRIPMDAARGFLRIKVTPM